MKTRHISVCLIGLAGALTMGCATSGIKHAYDGQPKAPADLAVILGTTNTAFRGLSPSRERISIAGVDDDDTLPWYSMASYPTAVYVLPGKRKLDIQYEYVHGVATGPIWVDAQSNRTYQVKVMNPQSRTERVYFVIQDITAQTLVGGQESQTPAPATPAAP